MFQFDFTSFRRDEDQEKTFQQMSLKFSLNLCDIIKDASSNVLFRLIRGVESYFRDLISKCPVEKGTVIVIPDQTLDSIPRQKQAPIIPSGYYRFQFDIRTTEPNVTFGKAIVEFQYRGYW
jgi:Protein of unknown function (DUF1091)